MSVHTLSLITNIDERMIYHVESGSRRLSIILIYRIAKALSVSINAILSDDLSGEIHEV